MSSNDFVIDARAAACRMPGLAVAPVTRVLGSESAYATFGSPVGTDAAGIVRVRDAKQAAPPRGELR